MNKGKNHKQVFLPCVKCLGLPASYIKSHSIYGYSDALVASIDPFLTVKEGDVTLSPSVP